MRTWMKKALGAVALSTTMLSGASFAQATPPQAAAPATSDTRPNILLILSDDNSVPHDGCHPSRDLTANDVTPNFTAFAKQGMCFDRAYSTSPQCAPARGSIVAGRDPLDIGISRFAEPASLDVRYFSDILRSSGYWVGLDGRIHHLGGREDDPPHVKQLLKDTGISRLDKRFDFVRVFGTKNVAPGEITRRLGTTLDKITPGKPFFLYFGFNQTHRPFIAPHTDIDPAKLTLPPDWPDLPAVRADYADYLSDLRQMDGQFGAVMQMLKDRKLADNTIVVFMGDNGESMYRGKGTLYERGNHVPLIVRWPGVAKAGAHTDALVSQIDLAKTFVEAGGQQPDPHMTGISLVPILRDPKAPGHDYVFTERGEHPGSLTVSEGVDYQRAITGVRYKLIYNGQPNQPYSPVDQGGRFLAPNQQKITSDAVPVLRAAQRTDEERAIGSWKAIVDAHQAKTLPAKLDRIYFQRPRPIFELYDLQADPYEFDNLAGKPAMKTIETDLRHRMDNWQVLSHDYLPLATDAYRETPDPTAGD